MSTVSLSIVGAYMSMIDAQYVVAALILNMFSTFIILSIINPYQVEDEPELKLNKLHEDQSFFEMLGEYILAGFKIAMIIAAMLIGFIALISAVNALFSAVLGISFQQILGYVFYPLAWLIGIPAEEALKAGSIMATKLVANEFVAMIELKKIAAELSPRGLGILSVFTVSFANFASIGIVAGAIKGLNEQQGNVVSRFGLKLVYGSTLVSLLSAASPARCCNPHSRPYGREFALKRHTHRRIHTHHRILRKLLLIAAAQRLDIRLTLFARRMDQQQRLAVLARQLAVVAQPLPFGIKDRQPVSKTRRHGCRRRFATRRR